MFVSNLFGVLANLNASVMLKSLRVGDDFAPRSTSSILLSYHSVGDVPNVWRIKEGPLPYYFSFDRCGYSGWSELASSAAMQARAQQIDIVEARRILSRVREEVIEHQISKYPQPSQLALLPEKFVFFPLQIISDTVLRLARLDMLEVLETAVRLATERHQHLVVKRHPLCKSPEVEHALDRIRDTRFVTVTDASVLQCIPRASAVLCCNSGVGFEALLQGKPVFCFGDSDYKAAAEQISQIHELVRVFDGDTSIPADGRDKFLAFFLAEFCFDARNLKDIEAKIQRAIEAAKSREEQDLLQVSVAHISANETTAFWKEQFEQLRNSRSWRLTAPLRALVRTIRNAQARVRGK